MSVLLDVFGSVWSWVTVAVSGMVPVPVIRASMSIPVDPPLHMVPTFQVRMLPFMVTFPPVSGLYPLSCKLEGSVMVTITFVASSGPLLSTSTTYCGDKP